MRKIFWQTVYLKLKHINWNKFFLSFYGEKIHFCWPYMQEMDDDSCFLDLLSSFELTVVKQNIPSVQNKNKRPQHIIIIIYFQWNNRIARLAYWLIVIRSQWLLSSWSELHLRQHISQWQSLVHGRKKFIALGDEYGMERMYRCSSNLCILFSISWLLRRNPVEISVTNRF